MINCVMKESHGYSVSFSDDLMTRSFLFNKLVSSLGHGFRFNKKGRRQL